MQQKRAGSQHRHQHETSMERPTARKWSPQGENTPPQQNGVEQDCTQTIQNPKDALPRRPRKCAGQNHALTGIRRSPSLATRTIATDPLIWMAERRPERGKHTFLQSWWGWNSLSWEYF